MKKFLILALLAGSAVMASAQYSLELTSHSSEFDLDNLDENVYKNVISVTKEGGFTKDEKFTIVRSGSGKSQDIVVTIKDATYYSIGTSVKKYSFSGNKLEITDNFRASTTSVGGDKTGSYIYTLGDKSVEVPVYSATLSASLVNDYSRAQILADTQGKLAVQECEISRTPSGTWNMYKNFEEVDLSDRDAVSETVQTYVGAIVDGGNTYGSNPSSINPGIVSYSSVYSDSTVIKSEFSYTGEDGKTYRNYRVPINLYFEYEPENADSDDGWVVKTPVTPTIQSDEETGGFRVWRQINDGAEVLVFDNVGEETVATKIRNGYYYLGGILKDGNDRFTAAVNSVVKFRMRAYYYMNEEEHNSYGAPAHHAPAVKAEQEKRYYISEVEFEIELDDESDHIITGVDDLNAGKQVSKVSYVNLAGVESNEAFDGMNIVVTRYTDGSTTVNKVIK